MATLTLACNFYNEKENIRAVLNCVSDIIDDYIVIDTYSDDGTPEIAKRLGARVYTIPIWIGYGMLRTIMLHLCFTDWMLILDGDERMDKPDVTKMKHLIDTISEEYDVIALPRQHYRKWDRSVCENPDIKQYADWQFRLVRVKPQIHWVRKVHEQIRGIGKIYYNFSNPIIRHFGWLKSPERKTAIVEMCNKLWKEDKEYAETYKLENMLGCASGEKYWEESPAYHKKNEQLNEKEKNND